MERDEKELLSCIVTTTAEKHILMIGLNTLFLRIYVLMEYDFFTLTALLQGLGSLLEYK